MTEEERKEYHRQYRLKNKDKLNEKRRQYCLKNKDKIAEQTKQYRFKNKKKLAERKKQYYNKNKDKIVEHVKQYRIKHAEQIKRRYIKIKDKKIEQMKQYRHKKYVARIGSYFRNNYSRYITLENYISISKHPNESLKRSVMVRLGRGFIDQNEAVKIAGVSLTNKDRELIQDALKSIKKIN